MELKKYWEIIWRRKWIVLQSLFLIVAATIITSKTLTPVYDATSKILVLKKSEELLVTVPGISPEIGSLNFLSTDPVSTQKDIIKSGHIMNKVIRNLNLFERETIIQKTLTHITRRKKEKEEKRFVRVKDFADAGFIVALLQKRWVEIDSEMESDVIKITAVSSDRQEAMNIANTVANIYLGTMETMNKSHAKNSIKFIQNQLLKAKTELDTAEKQLRAYKEKVELVSLDGEFLMQSGQDAEPKANEDSTRQRSEEDIESISGLKGKPEKAIDFLSSSKVIEDNPEIRELKSKLSELEMKLAGLRTEQSRYHPDVINLFAQIETVRGLLKEEIDRVVSSETMHLNKKYEEFKIKEKTYKMLLEQLDYALMAESMKIVNARVIEKAELPRKEDPLYPALMLYTIISIFIGLLFGVGLAFLLEYMDETIRDPDEFEKSSGLPISEKIPAVRRCSSLHAHLKKETLLIKAIWRLQLNLKKTLDQKKVFSVVSSSRKEGKSTICAYLGVLFAKSHLKTLLIDFNLRKPALHKFFKLPNRIGLTDALMDGEITQDLISTTAFENLSLITCGSSTSNTLEILNSPHLPKIIEALRPHYDLIIIDTPDIEGGNEPLIVSSQADGVLLIASLGKILLSKFINARESLKNANLEIIGMVINRTEK